MTPKKRVTNITIPGRDGTLTQSDETYDVFTRETHFVMMDLSKTQEICALYTDAGDLTFDDEPDKVYKARVVNELNPEWFTPGWRNLTIQFECQPFARELNPQTATFMAAGALYNQGTIKAYPAIKVYGSGDITVTVNGNPFTVKGVTASAIIDCENMQAYEGSTSLITSGSFPTLTLDKNTVSFAGTSKIEITPHWRWI
ncbi:MAG TPA: distal tail protein Dit [Caproicibacter sp.]|nr:distal tail protein Dit [Caproicibacter sp.]